MEGRAIGYPGDPGVQARAVSNRVPTPANPSCFGAIEAATERTMSAASRVEKIVNRLCGSIPEADQGEIRGVPAGIFDGAEQHARDIEANMSRIFAALDRLEKHLP